MDEQENKDKDFLLEIAVAVSELVADPGNMRRFREQNGAFNEVCKAWKKNYDVYCETMLEHRKVAEAKPQLQKNAGGRPPHRGWVWEQSFLPRGWKGFWRPPVEAPPPCPWDLLSVPWPETFESLAYLFDIDEEQSAGFDAELKRQADYVLVTIIHDKKLTGPRTPLINDGLWLAREAVVESCWVKLVENIDSEQARADITLTLERVKADLDKAEQEIKPVKEPQVHVELNLAERVLTIGTDQHRVSSESVWNFLKRLVSNSRISRITPRTDDENTWKNAVDTLRRQIGKDALRQVVQFSRDGYYLAASVNIEYGGQLGIRKTKS